MAGGVALAPWKYAREQDINNAYAVYAELQNTADYSASPVKPMHARDFEITHMGGNSYRLSWTVVRKDGSTYKDHYMGNAKSAAKFARKHGIYWAALKEYGGKV